MKLSNDINYYSPSYPIEYHCYSKPDIMKKDPELHVLKKSNEVIMEPMIMEIMCKNDIQLGKYYDHM